VDHVLSKFNFGEKFKEWVQMLFKYAQICLDQQKAFDRVEWEWVDHVLSKFNFGEQFKEWVQICTNLYQDQWLCV
jgi:hypothetical protein